MAESNKRTERKSQGVRSRHHVTDDTVSLQNAVNDQSEHASQSSRVMDMSWAAKYLDDDWEEKNSRKGGYDTKANAHADAAGTKEGRVDLMSQTQEFRPVNSEEPEEEMKIKDAVTDKTIASAADSAAVRDELSLLDFEDERSGIRDAVSDKRIVASVSETAALNEELRDLGHIRDARSQKTSPAAKASGKPEPSVKIPEKQSPAAPEKTNAPVSATGILSGMIRSDESKEDAAIPAGIKTPKKKSVKKQDKKPEASVKKAKKQADKPAANPRRSIPADRPAAEDFVPDDRYDSRYEERYDERYDDRYDERYDDRYDDRYRPAAPYYGYYVPVKSPLRFIPLVLVIALCVLGFITARVVCHDVPINASDYSKISYTVNEGLTDEMLSADLMSLGLIDNPLVFRLRCIFYDAKYVQGTYELSPCYSTEKMINILSGYQYGDAE